MAALVVAAPRAQVRPAAVVLGERQRGAGHVDRRAGRHRGAHAGADGGLGVGALEVGRFGGGVGEGHQEALAEADLAGRVSAPFPSRISAIVLAEPEGAAAQVVGAARVELGPATAVLRHGQLRTGSVDRRPRRNGGEGEERAGARGLGAGGGFRRRGRGVRRRDGGGHVAHEAGRDGAVANQAAAKEDLAAGAAVGLLVDAQGRLAPPDPDTNAKHGINNMKSTGSVR
ncbi:hypothetical protein DFJ74DRAFT_657094 [Hyaloraphidium curvatum]|nr:hypothetical protein DFJ74DRAFT_657094 [Hyaloraphidium curvatum]